MKHETKNTISVRRWCNKCKTQTDHRVNGGRVNNVCIPCQDKAEAEHQARLKAEAENPRAVQEALFA